MDCADPRRAKPGEDDMMKTLAAAIAIAAVTGAGPAQAFFNGTQLNGPELMGIQLNGYELMGIQLNGPNLMGVDLINRQAGDVAVGLRVLSVQLPSAASAANKR